MKKVHVYILVVFLCSVVIAVSVDFLLKNYSFGPKKPLLTEMVLEKPIPSPEPKKTKEGQVPPSKILSEEEDKLARIERVIGKKIPPRLDSAIQDFERCQDLSYEKIIAFLTTSIPDPTQLRYLVLLTLLEGNSEKCDLISSKTENTFCRDLFNSYYVNMHPCENIEEESVKAFCLSAYTGDPEKCSSKTGYTLVKCKAVALKNLEMCNQLDESIGKGSADGCKGNIYLHTAVKEINVDLCEN